MCVRCRTRKKIVFMSLPLFSYILQRSTISSQMNKNRWKKYVQFYWQICTNSFLSIFRVEHIKYASEKTHKLGYSNKFCGIFHLMPNRAFDIIRKIWKYSRCSMVYWMCTCTIHWLQVTLIGDVRSEHFLFSCRFDKIRNFIECVWWYSYDVYNTISILQRCRHFPHDFANFHSNS